MNFEYSYYHPRYRQQQRSLQLFSNIKGANLRHERIQTTTAIPTCLQIFQAACVKSNRKVL